MIITAFLQDFSGQSRAQVEERFVEHLFLQFEAHRFYGYCIAWITTSEVKNQLLLLEAVFYTSYFLQDLGKYDI